MTLCFLCQVAFTLPTTLPVNSSNLNWTPVTVGVAMTVVLCAWFMPRWGARHWYHGKAHTLEDTRVVSCLAWHLLGSACVSLGLSGASDRLR